MPRGELLYACEFSLLYVMCVRAGGKKGGHKGKAKRYTTFEEVEEQEKKKQREQQWRVSEAQNTFVVTARIRKGTGGSLEIQNTNTVLNSCFSDR